MFVFSHFKMRRTILFLLTMFSFLNVFGKKEISYEKKVAKPTFKIIDMNEEWMRRKYMRDTTGLHDFEERTARKMMKYVSALKECYTEIPDSAEVKPRIKSLIENFQSEQDILRSLRSDNNTFIQNVNGISFMVPDPRRHRKPLITIYRP